MSDLISRSALIEELKKYFIENKIYKNDLAEAIAKQHIVDAVPLSEIYRVIAGHSNYHGDNILSALTCIAEGKKVVPIKPLEPVRGEWIPVEERLPKFGEKVLCSLNPNNPTIIYLVVISRYDDSHHWHDGIITAWMPLPAPFDMRKKVEC